MLRKSPLTGRSWLPSEHCQQLDRARCATVYFVRHGTTGYNLEGRWQGEINTELAPQGIEEATAAARAFTDQGVSFDAAYCSDLNRAHHTAKILSQPHDLVPTPCRALREPCLGEFEGLHKTVIHGEKYKHIFDKLLQLPHQDRINASYFDGVETPQQTSDRVVAFLRDTVVPNHGGQVVMLVTHSQVIESILAVLRGDFFEGISMRRLAWIRCLADPDGNVVFEHLDGFKFSDQLSLK